MILQAKWLYGFTTIIFREKMPSTLRTSSHYWSFAFLTLWKYQRLAVSIHNCLPWQHLEWVSWCSYQHINSKLPLYKVFTKYHSPKDRERFKKHSGKRSTAWTEFNKCDCGPRLTTASARICEHAIRVEYKGKCAYVCKFISKLHYVIALNAFRTWSIFDDFTLKYRRIVGAQGEEAPT